jgi:hypothetical protein
MPAPVPIRVRYGPSGELLAQAAFAAGRGARQQRQDDINREMLERQRARDAATLRAMLDYNAQIRSDQQDAVPMYRRTAADEPAVYGQPVQPAVPADFVASTGASVVSRASAGLPQEPTELERWQNFRQVQNQQVRLAELDRYARENPEVRKDPNWQRLLTQTAAGEDVDESVFQQMVQQTGAADTPAVRAKRAYLTSLAPELGLSDAEIQALEAAAMDPDMSMASFRQAVNDAVRRTTGRQDGGQLSPQRRITEQIDLLEDQQRAIQGRMRELRRALEQDDLYTVGGDETQFTTTRERFFGRDKQAVDEVSLQRFREYQQLRQQLSELTQQRAQLILQGGTVPGPDTTAPPSNPNALPPAGSTENFLEIDEEYL